MADCKTVDKELQTKYKENINELSKIGMEECFAFMKIESHLKKTIYPLM
jgi:hypothetical protein